MPEIKFVDAEIPELTRERKPNPFVPVVEQLAKTRKAKAMTLPCKTEADEKALKTAIQQLQSAGKQFDVTVRKTVARDKGVATVTVWAVDRIERKRGSETHVGD